MYSVENHGFVFDGHGDLLEVSVCGCWKQGVELKSVCARFYVVHGLFACHVVILQ